MGRFLTLIGGAGIRIDGQSLNGALNIKIFGNLKRYVTPLPAGNITFYIRIFGIDVDVCASCSGIITFTRSANINITFHVKIVSVYIQCKHIVSICIIFLHAICSAYISIYIKLFRVDINGAL